MGNSIQQDKEEFCSKKEQFLQGKLSIEEFKWVQNELICKYGEIQNLTQKAIRNILLPPKDQMPAILLNLFTRGVKSQEHPEGRETTWIPLIRAIEDSDGILHILSNEWGNFDAYDRSKKTLEKKQEQGEAFTINASCLDWNFGEYLTTINKFVPKDIKLLTDLARFCPELKIVKVNANQRNWIQVPQELVDILWGEVLPAYAKSPEELTPLKENDLLIQEQRDRWYFYRVWAFEANQTYELWTNSFEKSSAIEKFNTLKTSLQQMQNYQNIQYSEQDNSINITTWNTSFSIQLSQNELVCKIWEEYTTNIDFHQILNKLNEILTKQAQEREKQEDCKKHTSQVLDILDSL